MEEHNIDTPDYLIVPFYLDTTAYPQYLNSGLSALRRLSKTWISCPAYTENKSHTQISTIYTLVDTRERHSAYTLHFFHHIGMIGPLALRGHEPWGQESFHIRHVLTARYVADYDNDNPTDTRKRNIPLSSEVLDIDIMTEGILLAEAHTRARIGAILFKTLAIAEKKDGMTQEKVSSSSTQSAQSVLLQYATHMMMPSGLFNKKRDLVSGRTDYSLWYGGPSEMEVDFVVSEAGILGGLSI